MVTKKEINMFLQVCFFCTGSDAHLNEKLTNIFNIYLKNVCISHTSRDLLFPNNLKSINTSYMYTQRQSHDSHFNIV